MITVDKLDSETFEVTVNGPPETVHRVTLPERVRQDLTGGALSSEQLLEASFRFLLERESSTSILPSFELTEIGRYFPEWEAHVRAMC